MRSIFEDSSTYVYVVKADCGLSEAGGNTLDDLTVAGSIGVFYADTNALEDDDITSSTANLVIGYRNSDGVTQLSPTFKGTSITNAVSVDHSARVEQVTFLGYNGTSGSLDEEVGYYGLKISLDHTFGLLNNSPLIKTIPYKLTTASQAALAIGLAGAGYTAFGRDPNRDVVFEAVCDVAASATNDFDNACTVVRGAKTFTIATSLEYNGGGGTLVAGDYIRIAPSTAVTDLATDNSTTRAYPVYKVITAVDAGATCTVTVDRPMLSVTTEAYEDGDDAMQVIPAATAAAANWGVKMTGSTPTTFDPWTDTPYVVSFKVQSDDFETAEVTYSTAASMGIGEGQVVAFEEAAASFQYKDRVVQAYPRKPNTTLAASVTGDYNVIDFEASDSQYTSATTGINPKSKFRVRIYFLDTTADADYGTMEGVLGGI